MKTENSLEWEFCKHFHSTQIEKMHLHCVFVPKICKLTNLTVVGTIFSQLIFVARLNHKSKYQIINSSHYCDGFVSLVFCQLINVKIHKVPINGRQVTNLWFATCNVNSRGHMDCLSLLLCKKPAQPTLQHAPVTRNNGPCHVLEEWKSGWIQGNVQWTWQWPVPKMCLQMWVYCAGDLLFCS